MLLQGYLTVKLEAHGVPGHSSAPPAVSAIGTLAKAIAALENNQMPSHLSPISNTFQALLPGTRPIVVCALGHADARLRETPPLYATPVSGACFLVWTASRCRVVWLLRGVLLCFRVSVCAGCCGVGCMRAGLDTGLRAVASNLWLFGGLFTRKLASDSTTAPMVRTTTAVTVVEGGMKENVMPATATAIVNHRIHPADTIQSVLAHDTEVLCPSTCTSIRCCACVYTSSSVLGH